MKRKVITYFLLSIFIFSTVGVPVTIHYCQMMNTISFQSCGMCEKDSRDCCKDDNYRTNIDSGENGLCCNTKYAVQHLTEKYISSLNEIQKIDFKNYVFTIPAENLLSEVITQRSLASNNSPPGTYSNSLYLNNSILLI